MKRIPFMFLFSVLLLSACSAGGGTTSGGNAALVVTDGETEVTYTAEDLQALGADQATFNDVTYLGVPLKTLLEDAGFEPQSLRAVKVSAVDGYTFNYDPATFLLPDTLVAYARLDGPLAEDELPFRMVLPNAEGKLNVRMVTEIKAIP